MGRAQRPDERSLRADADDSRPAWTELWARHEMREQELHALLAPRNSGSRQAIVVSAVERHSLRFPLGKRCSPQRARNAGAVRVGPTSSANGASVTAARSHVRLKDGPPRHGAARSAPGRPGLLDVRAIPSEDLGGPGEPALATRATGRATSELVPRHLGRYGHRERRTALTGQLAVRRRSALWSWRP